MRWADEAARDQHSPAPIAVSSQSGEGLEEVVTEICKAAEDQRQQPDTDRERSRLRRRLLRRARQEWIKKGLELAGGEPGIDRLVDEVMSGQMDVGSALSSMIK